MAIIVDFNAYLEAVKDRECIKRRVEQERLKGGKHFIEWKPAERAAQKVVENLKAGLEKYAA